MQDIDLNRFISTLPEWPHIHAKENFFNAAVLVPFVKTGTDYSLLFQQRAADIRQGTEISFPGGMFDPSTDKTFKDTAIRETIEETGLTPSQIRILGRMDTLVAPMGVTVDIFPAVCDIPDVSLLSCSTCEVETHFTVPVSFFLNTAPARYHVRLEVQPSYTDKKGQTQILLPSKELGLPERYHKPWGGKKFQVYVYQPEGYTIWGITAEIIVDIVARMRSNQ